MKKTNSKKISEKKKIDKFENYRQNRKISTKTKNIDDIENDRQIRKIGRSKEVVIIDSKKQNRKDR